jgi:hypothetical protein
MEKHARLQSAARTAAPWLLEGIFIVVSVLLGFAATQYGERRANRELAQRAVTSLQAELEHNLATVEPYVDFHRRFAEALNSVGTAASDESGFQFYLKVRPEVPKNAETDMPMLRRAAWDAALSSNALRLIDYDLIASLAEIYQMQDHLGAAIARAPVGSQAFFDPRERVAAVRQTQAALGEVMWAEQSLASMYRKQLPVLQEATRE